MVTIRLGALVLFNESNLRKPEPPGMKSMKKNDQMRSAEASE